MSTTVTGPAPMVPTLKIAGIPTAFTLAADTADLAVKGAIGAAVRIAGFDPSKVKVTATSWSIITERVREVVIFDEETDDLTTLGVVFPRRSVTVSAPIGADGRPVAVPTAVTVSAFDKSEKARSVALAPMARKPRAERRDGKLTGKILPVAPLHYGRTEYTRPSGAVFAYVVAILPSADGSKWRIGAMVAN